MDGYILRLLNPWNAENKDKRESPDKPSSIINYILDYTLSICSGGFSVKTQSKVSNITRACKDWVLFYTVLYNYNKYHNAFLYDGEVIKSLLGENATMIVEDWKDKHREHMEIICNIIKHIKSDKKSPYYIMFYDNKPTGLLQIINSFNDLCEHTPPTTEQWTLCINNTTGIFHFFLLLKLNGVYYISSSYGSDNITVSQYTTKLTDFEEFNYFCSNIGSIVPYRKKKVKEFYVKHFLLYNKKTRIDDDDIDLLSSKERLAAWASWLTPEQGIQKEIYHLFEEGEFIGEEKSFHISLIKGYNEYVEEYVDTEIAALSRDLPPSFTRSSDRVERRRVSSRNRSPIRERDTSLGRVRSRSMSRSGSSSMSRSGRSRKIMSGRSRKSRSGRSRKSRNGRSRKIRSGRSRRRRKPKKRKI